MADDEPGFFACNLCGRDALAKDCNSGVARIFTRGYRHAVLKEVKRLRPNRRLPANIRLLGNGLDDNGWRIGHSSTVDSLRLGQGFSQNVVHVASDRPSATNA